MSFIRNISDKNIQAMESLDIYEQHVFQDCKNGTVFPALRNGAIGFYYKGGRPFEYSNERFSTHRKYLTMLKPKESSDYYSEDELSNVEIIRNFANQYKAILSNSALYAGVEAVGVSKLYENYSYCCSNSDVVILDIEVCFKSLVNEKKNNKDRIDLLLYKKSTGELQFVEVKHFSNSELWSKKGTNPKVLSQIERYNRHLEGEQQRLLILEQYIFYIEIMNRVLQLDLPKPKSIKNSCGLYVFGFDKNQRDGRLQELLIGDGSLDDVPYYTVGNEKKVDIINLWNNLSRRRKENITS